MDDSAKTSHPTERPNAQDPVILAALIGAAAHIISDNSQQNYLLAHKARVLLDRMFDLANAKGA